MGKNDAGKKKNEDTEIMDESEVIDAAEEEIIQVEDALKKQNSELLDKLQRSLAEFDNFRKRTIKEKSEMFDIGAIGVVEKILPVIDNFERAISAAPDQSDSMYTGVVMIYKQLNEALNELGVEAIECLGAKFDPNIHDAVAHEKSDEYAENTVMEELRKGYKYKEKVIRPSMVKVAN